MTALLNLEDSRQRARIEGLDVLRGIAVLLVIGRHYMIAPLWKRIGWSGVDIFFVLSGFLVSGLLFREFRRDGSVGLKRFWIRRAFKIYPPFLIMLGVTAAMRLRTGPAFDASRILAELTWTQNYFPGLWVHTWSLAVEEHFYVILPLLFAFLIARNYRINDPFRALPTITAVVAIAVLLMRAIEVYYVGFEPRIHLFATHLRIDALLFGVMLSYFYWYHRDVLLKIAVKRKSWLFTGTASLVAPVFFLPVEHWLIYTVGLTLVYVGSGCAVMLSLVGNYHTGHLSTLFRSIGKRSYSIYLWHLAVLNSLAIVRDTPALARIPGIEAIVYVLGSVLVGFIMYALIEVPAIRLRDYLVPAEDHFRPKVMPSRDQQPLMTPEICS